MPDMSDPRAQPYLDANAVIGLALAVAEGSEELVPIEKFIAELENKDLVIAALAGGMAHTWLHFGGKEAFQKKTLEIRLGEH